MCAGGAGSVGVGTDSSMWRCAASTVAVELPVAAVVMVVIMYIILSSFLLVGNRSFKAADESSPFTN